MRTYAVKMPFSGYVELVVEAENEDSAEEAFYEKWEKHKGLGDPALEMAWEFKRIICQGNVLDVELNEMEITDETPDEE